LRARNTFKAIRGKMAFLIWCKSHPSRQLLCCCHNDKGKTIYEKLAEITNTMFLLPCSTYYRCARFFTARQYTTLFTDVIMSNIS
jgi:hypothetical protein